MNRRNRSPISSLPSQLCDKVRFLQHTFVLHQGQLTSVGDDSAVHAVSIDI